jgi:hypothetical protein
MLSGPQFVGLEVFTAMQAQTLFVFVVSACSLLDVYQRFGGTYCIHLQSDVHDIFRHFVLSSCDFQLFAVPQRYLFHDDFICWCLFHLFFVYINYNIM